MNILFFDTETTGVPKNYKAAMQDVDNWPRIIQLAWEVADAETEQVVTGGKMLIKPDGWQIPKEKFWIENGYSTEQNDVEGTPMPQALDLFLRDLNQSEVMVAHNLAFDYPIVGAELIRYEKRATNNKTRVKICTMERTVNLCRIPFQRGGYGYKWPKLEELHQFLFKKGFDGAHDAGNDVAACRVSFFELVRRNFIEMPII